MRKPNGRLGPFVLVAACAAVIGGCKEDFSDQEFGVLDLATLFDGGTPDNPAGGLPTQIGTQTGYVDGNQGQYYDFGSIPVKRNPLTGQPLSASVQPIYFFYDTGGHPLFSTSVRETRDGGIDWMRGGIGVVNPNPKDFCAGVDANDANKQKACKQQNDDEKKKPYGVRVRDPLPDNARGGTTNYQRPIVDFSPGDIGTYTGLWEVYEVVVADGYVPDAVKHKATMDRAIAAGKMVARTTQKVINCPIVDERTAVSPGVAAREVPHPRIELWYRRQLTYCYLANGWETLGRDDGSLLPPNADDARVQTFDVSTLVVGEGSVQQTRLVVPISNIYIPTVLTSDQGFAEPTPTVVVDNLLSRGRPKHTRDDPPGYTPIRWVWNLQVGPDYLQGSLTDVSKIDLTNASTGGAVRNIPIRGVQVACGWPMDLSRHPDPNRPTAFWCGRVLTDANDPLYPLDPTNDPVCTKLGLECNKESCYCDVPHVGYGQVCGPNIAECLPHDRGDSFNQVGYTCLLNYCYMRCDVKLGNSHSVAENAAKKPTEFLDSRCKSLPGYHCLPFESSRWGICVKLCDSNVDDPKQCSANADAGGGMQKDIGAGQICQDLGIEVCSWPDGYNPP